MFHHRWTQALRWLLLLSMADALSQPAWGQYGFHQQGDKLVGAGALGAAVLQGSSVALSGDGNTAIVGGPTNNEVCAASACYAPGGAWMFTRVNGAWSQQGTELVGSGWSGFSWQGSSVALSSDGNSALVGGPHDNGNMGAAWVFTRTGESWTQQGDKLVGTGSIGQALQGGSVALAADGNTAIVGGAGDNQAGAAWVYVRANGVWTEQGSKLVGSGWTGSSSQGFAVAISADGNTAALGGTTDNQGAGAVWVFTRVNGAWVQQGTKLVGGLPSLGFSLALSADGNTLLAGSPGGGAAVFTRAGGVWAAQGNLLGTGVIQQSTGQQGYSVGLSGDGNTAVLGGPGDNAAPGTGSVGATWVFTRSNGIWSQSGSKLVGGGSVNAAQGSSVAISADGRTIVAGGPYDAGSLGAAWVFVLGYLTSTTLSASTSEGASGQPVTFTARVSVALCSPLGPCTALYYPPTGSVTFYDGQWPMGTGTPDFYGVASFTTVLTSGPHSITAAFNSSDPKLQNSVSQGISIQVNGGVADQAAVTLTSNLSSPTLGQKVTLGIFVAGSPGSPVPSGTVDLWDGGRRLGSVPLVDGAASFNTVFTSTGNHTIMARYSGDATYPAASTLYGLTVTSLPSSLTLTSSASSTVFGQPVTFTATLQTTAAAGVAPPTGMVQFVAGCACGFFGSMIDRTVLGTVAVSNGVATLTVANLGTGSPQVVATYFGDQNWGSVSSRAITQTVVSQ